MFDGHEGLIPDWFEVLFIVMFIYVPFIIAVFQPKGEGK
jgi:hypothetical protein